MRIAVVGTYRSGSSAVAGALHHLGLELGAPFFYRHFEAQDLAAMLRQWWKEPLLVGSLPRQQRRRLLAQWIEKREQTSKHVAAKHPLLSLCLEDLWQAWGSETRFIWCRRPLEESIESLVRCQWWQGAEQIQRKLHGRLEAFFAEHEHLPLEFCNTLKEPAAQLQRITSYLNLQPSAEQMASAMDWLSNGRTEIDRPSQVNVAPTTMAPPMRPAKIVATLLCGNSEAIVGDAVASIVDWVDEVRLIDTGMTDGSLLEVTKAAGPKLSPATFAWCNNFAMARNAALQEADQSAATWALTIDTDERIEFPGLQNKQQLLDYLDSDAKVNAWMVSARDGSYSKERFIRIPSQLHWQGRTHEALIGAAPHERKLLPGCRFWEVFKSKDAYRHKVERDEQILLEETADQPLNPRWWYYLGQTYEGLKQFRRAVEAFDNCIRLDGWPDESSWACYTAARCLVALEEYREAEEYCALGMARKPSLPELPWLAGWCCFKRGEWRSAITWSKLAIVLGHDKGGDNAGSFRHLPAWYEAPYDVLRHAYRELAMVDLARDAEREFETYKEARLAAQSVSSL